ncbi:MAG TPA: sodium-independent anion transporter [Pusillimonas sp.]|nr:sodium-independent anion transporter [Pusillimonas sp.]
MFALQEAWRAGLLGPRYWLPNIVAGLIVGVVALPLGMAFAIASGAKPEQGLYTAIVAGLCVSVFGGSRVQIAGPTGAFIVILADIVARYGVGGLQIATFMAGLILVLFALFRLGVLVRYISPPVIIGFTAGIGVIIWVGQWKEFFGLPVLPEGHFHQKLWVLLQSFSDINPAVTAVALVSLALVVVPKWLPYRLGRIPGPLLALVVMTLLQAVSGFEWLPTIGSAYGDIPRALPAFQGLSWEYARWFELLGPAVAIAMLGSIESLLSASVADRMAGTRHNPNSELFCQGLANIFSPLFGGFAATGAIARTATNIRSGGSTPVAGIVHAVTLILIVLVLAPYASHVPLATLAAILFVVAWNMSEVPHALALFRRAPRFDTLTLLITFTLTVFVDLIVAVCAGVLLSRLHLIPWLKANKNTNT